MTSAQEDPSGHGPQPPAEPRYPVSAVARRIGVAPATLRTWDRRYGLGPTGHPFGSHRRYTAADVTRLLAMRRLVVEGVPPAEAARVVLGQPTSTARPVEVPPVPDLEPAATGEAHPPVPVRGRHGGGRVLSLPGATPEMRGLASAAMALDGATMTALVRSAVRERGVAAAWHDLLVPVLTAIGDRWAATHQGVDVEHLLSECALVALREVRLDAGPGITGSGITGSGTDPRVLLGAAAGDYHALPTHVLAAALAERGIAARLLGAAVPPEALAAAVRRVRPAVVFCWSSLRETGDRHYLDAVPGLVPPVAVVVGGPGWPSAELPEGVAFVRDVQEALAVVAAHLGR